MTVFWLKHDILTLSLHKQVDSIPFDSRGSIRENWEPTGAILANYWGPWGAENSDEWAVASGQWHVGRGAWAVAHGPWRVKSDEWTVASGQWRVDSGE